MLKKLLWLSILVLLTACAAYVSTGGLLTTSTPTVTPAFILPTTPAPTIDSTEIITDTDPTSDSTLEPTDVATLEQTESVTDVATATEVFSPTAIYTSTTIPSVTPTATVIPSATPTATTIPSATPTATSIPMPYAVQPATPVFMTNFAHADAGCNWQGVAGQVFDSSGNSVKNYVVKVTGVYNNASISLLGITGMVSGNPYGLGSYEIILGTTPVDSIDLLTIQVFDSTGKGITDPLKFSTSSDCSKNLVIINFKQK